MAKFDALEQQLDYIRGAAVEIISEAELAAKLRDSEKTGRPLRVKVGFDPTAPDIHLGHTVLLRLARRFQELGHQMVFIVGDFTALIGDPTGRTQTRPPLSDEEIAENAKTYHDQAFKILDRDRTEIHYNSAWLDSLSSREMIELTAKSSVARMIERDDFSNRWRAGKPISIHEFLYPLLQAYDSVAARADVELGGIDQKFNLLLGRSIQRAYGQPEQSVALSALLEGTDGARKMSKSYQNYIGVAESPDQIFGKIMSISDELALRYYEILSDIPPEEIEALRAGIAAGKINPKDSKVALGIELVERYHSRKFALAAAERFELMFTRKKIPDEIPEFHIDSDDDRYIVNILKDAGQVKSVGEGRRLIQQGAVAFDDGTKLTDPQMSAPTGESSLKIGKRRHLKIIRAAQARKP